MKKLTRKNTLAVVVGGSKLRTIVPKSKLPEATVEEV
jgi:hypothetical protein